MEDEANLCQNMQDHGLGRVLKADGLAAAEQGLQALL